MIRNQVASLLLAAAVLGCLVEPFPAQDRPGADSSEAGRPRLAGLAPAQRSVGAASPDPDETVAARTLSDAFAEVARVATPAVVSLEVEQRSRPTFDLPDMFRGGVPQDPPIGRGSGAIVSPEGLILTNYHVIQGAEQIRATFADDRQRTATVVGTDPPTDLAVLRLEADDGEEFPWLAIGNSDEVRVGDWVLAIGNPLGNSHSVTAGIVSAKGRVLGGDYQDYIQTDAAINRGNSGGPLVNLDGQLVGINTMIQVVAQMGAPSGNIGIGFAIPSHLARRVYDELARDGEVTRGWLGVAVRPLDAGTALAFGLDEDVRGAIIEDYSGPDSPARKSGLLRGDVIVRFNGRPIASSVDLQFAVADARPGEVSNVEILRDGELVDMDVVLARRDLEAAAPLRRAQEPPPPASEPDAADRLGIAGEALTPERARELEIDFEGVLVRRVAGNGLAARVGIEPGHVITEVSGTPVRSVADLRSALDAIPAGTTFPIWFAVPLSPGEWRRTFAIVEMPESESGP